MSVLKPFTIATAGLSRSPVTKGEKWAECENPVGGSGRRMSRRISVGSRPTRPSDGGAEACCARAGAGISSAVTTSSEHTMARARQFFELSVMWLRSPFEGVDDKACVESFEADDAADGRGLFRARLRCERLRHFAADAHDRAVG